jgi:CheY-like chemotaxis protein
MASVQRLESIGKLAGGVAHDFNNIVQAISGFAELASDSEGENLLNYIDEIKKASSKAAELTGQLLAFARKQPVFPRPLDLNSAVRNSMNILQRLMVGRIDLELKAEKDLWSVIIDPSQVDQIVTNLVVNSRDALSGSGKIIIETYNKIIDSEYCNCHAEFIPGKYAVLAVSDNGCGMDKDTESHIFEPFFTIKETAGIGLGLSTVYGIVRQNGGFISVYTEKGIGTTIKVFLKKGNLPVQEKIEKLETVDLSSGGTKTILVVEDEKSILTLIKKVLEKASYIVFTASSGNDAISEVEKYSGEIDLLLTDVVLPGMNGQQIDKKIREIIPEIQTIYMSGYTANIIENGGIIDEGVNFLQKPFSVADLLKKVRDLLE